MIIHRKPITITAESDLDALLDEAAMAPVLLKRRGMVYRLSLKEDDRPIFEEPDPEQVRQILHETIGSWADLDIDKIIHDIYEARKAGSRYPVDP